MMKKTKAKNIKEFIAETDKSLQPTLRKLHSAIKKAAPKSLEQISYGMPQYSQNGVLAYFNAYKTHIGFYPGPMPIQQFASELKKFETSKGTVKFEFDAKIPFGLITKMIRFKLKDNMGKVRPKGFKAKKLPKMFSGK